MQIIMTKGLPGSGKTTWARKMMEAFPGMYKRINKDDLRAMLDAGMWSKKNENFVLQIRNLFINEALYSGYDVIVDDTNLHPKHEEDLRNLATKYGADFIIQDFTDIPLSTCIERDSKRENSVGRNVILQMYNQFIKKEYKQPKGKAHCILCDLDGTLALFTGNPYDRDFSQDKVNPAVYQILENIAYRNGDDPNIHPMKIMILSGRTDKAEPETKEWLEKFLGEDHDLPYELHMRKEGDNRKDAIVKQEMFEEFVKDKYQVDFVLDDRNQVVDLWRGMGLTCFQVNYGDF